MDTNQAEKILKAFPLATEESPEGYTFEAYHFIPVDNSDTFHCVKAPYFLRAAIDYQIDSKGINEFGTTPENAQLLLDTLVFDGKMFGIWLTRSNQKAVWVSVRAASSQISKRERRIFFKLLNKHLSTFKTYLLLLEVDISHKEYK
jgi:hypothetical protein